MNQIDTRGYSCPEPVLMTRRALEQGVPLQVLTDSEVPKENICRFAGNAGYQTTCKQVGEDYEITITK